MSAWEKVKYVKYCVFHPFDGFYEAKNRGKCSLLAATLLIILYCILDCVEVQYTGFIMNNNMISRMNSVTIFISALTVILLAIVSNWTITTLFEGKGKMKDIYMVVGYSLLPMVLIDAVIVFASNYVIEEEAVILTAIRWIGIAWSAFLIVTGLCTIHEFSLAKTLVTIVATLIAAIIILFLIVLFISLLEQMFSFIYIFSKEFMRRI